jgi:hypothetical protein
MAHLGTKPNVYYIPVKKQTISYERADFGYQGQNSEGGLHPMGAPAGTFTPEKAAEHAAHEHASLFDADSPFAQLQDIQAHQIKGEV